MKSNLDKRSSLDNDKLPSHIAMIMDGNGRWAKKRLMNRVKGHEKGSRTVRDIVTGCRELGIKVLTLYAFSTENWARPKAEVKALMTLLKRFVINERPILSEHNIRLNIIGQKQRLPAAVLNEVDATLEMTKDNDGMVLNLALSYGSREEITAAVTKIAQQVQQGQLKPDDICEDLISDHLYTRNMQDPDLIIRTSGEYRLSNFLMWQAAYSEIYISKTLWPDFSKDELIDILINFQERDRRFGKVACSTSNDG